MNDKYSTILYLKYPFPNNEYKKMSMHDRAAQFAPFAALTGYDESVKEEARLTDHKIELSEDEKNYIDQILVIIQESIQDQPTINVEYFIPDQKKFGGYYQQEVIVVKKIDDIQRQIISSDNKKINIIDILKIEIID